MFTTMTIGDIFNCLQVTQAFITIQNAQAPASVELIYRTHILFFKRQVSILKAMIPEDESKTTEKGGRSPPILQLQTL